MSNASPFPYTGGKKKLLPFLLPHVPEHDVYVEPFAGGLALLRAKARATCEVINDANRDLITFYRYVRYHNAVLRRELSTCLQSRADFEDLKASVPMTDLQRALRWYFLQVASFGGKGQHFGRSRTDYHGFDARRHLQLITQLQERLQGVYIEHGDWERVVDWYDGPSAFMFFDPPYLGCADVAYAANNEFDLQRLSNRVRKLKARWMLTINDSPATREIFAGLPFQELSIRYSLGSRHVARAKVSGELLVLSPNLPTAVASERLAA
jgi:DNA adenine methylase